MMFSIFSLRSRNGVLTTFTPRTVAFRPGRNFHTKFHLQYIPMEGTMVTIGMATKTAVVVFGVIYFLTFKGIKMHRHLSKLINAVTHAVHRNTSIDKPAPVSWAISVGRNGNSASLKPGVIHSVPHNVKMVESKSLKARVSRLMFEVSLKPSFTNTAMLIEFVITPPMLKTCVRVLIDIRMM